MMTADLYGTCIRDRPERNDCYWGKDATGRDDGCLKIGWKGRQCPHWRPAARLMPYDCAGLAVTT